MHKILTNPVYLGLIPHKEKTYPGKHPAIIDQRLWDRVQDLLQAASARRRGAAAGEPITDAAPLKGRFRDETGDLLTPTHTQRRGKQLRYYISNRLVSGGPDPTGWRLPAETLELAVARAISDHLANHAKRHAILVDAGATASLAASRAIMDLASRISTEGASFATRLIASGRLGTGRLALDLDRDALADAAALPAGDLAPVLLALDMAFSCRRRGVEMKIVAGDRAPEPDAAMIRALRNAHRWADALKSGTPLKRLAADEKTSERYLARIIALAGLSPKIQTAILDGKQPIDLTLKRLLRTSLPLDWHEQETALGFGA